MAYVNMTKDFSEVKKVIPGLGITKRQLFGFIAGASVGIPITKQICMSILENMT